MEDDWEEITTAENKPKGKFDIEQVDDWEEISATPSEPTGIARVGQSIKEGLMRPAETAHDFVNSVSYGNIFRKPVAKAVSAIEAGAQEVGDLFRPEDKQRAFKERLMENYRARMQMDDERQKEREGRSPFAAS